MSKPIDWDGKLQIQREVNGEKVWCAVLFCVDNKSESSYSMLLVYALPCGTVHTTTATRDGETFRGCGIDVRNAPETVEIGKRWINVYPDGCVGLRDSRERADKGADPARIACVEIDLGTIEVGHGLHDTE